MKRFILALIIVAALPAFAEVVPEYQIISDSTDASVPSGKCKIYGTTTLDGVPVPNCKVATTDRAFTTTSDSTGHFELIISSGTKQLYMFQIGLREIVTQPHNFRSGYGVHLDFYLRENDMIYMEEKPVIYLYSEQEQAVNIKMSTKGELTFTYPEYKNEWNVTTNSNGELTSTSTGKKYPYLFWEGKSNISFTSPTFAFDGFLIDTDSTISFLENNLSLLGLNHKEQTDFITYWGPRLQQKEQVLIQFLVDEEYTNHVSSIAITPAPTSSKRVYMIFTHDIPEQLVVSPQQFEPFHRSGLTLIEWGGSQINLNQLEN